MIHRLCLFVSLIALAACNGSEGDGDAVDAVPIRVPPLDGPERVPLVPVEPPPAPDATDLPAEIERRLVDVFSLLDADSTALATAVARRLIDVEVGPRPGFELLRSGVNPETGIEDTTLGCPGGGTLDTFSNARRSSDGVMVLRDCGVGPFRLDGRIEGRVRGPEREIEGEAALEPFYEFDGFTLVDERDGRLFSTDILKLRPSEGWSVADRLGYGRLVGEDPRADVGPGALHERRGGRSVTVLDGLDTRVGAAATSGSPAGGLTTRFDLRFGDEPAARVEVRTVVPFDELDPEGRFARGSLTVVSEEGGYAYTLDAANGDPATFRLDVVEDGATTSYLVPWSDALGFDAFEPEAIDVGF